MLSQELRPLSFDEMAGQEENKRILKAIIKNPDKAPKCLIFAGAFGSGKTTSARIMARELNKIKDRDYDLLSSPFYYEYDSTVMGNVETIRNLRDQFLVSFGDYYRIIVLDECLYGDSEVLLADGSYMKIKDIVKNEVHCEVMSYNKDKDILEPKRVIGWFENSPKIFYKVVTTKSKKSVKVSDNHLFITKDGEKTIKDLHIGDKLLTYKYKLSEDERQIILGSILGDGSMGDVPRNSLCASPRLALTQGVAQLDWLKLKHSALSNIMADEGIVRQAGDKLYEKSYAGSKDVYRANTKSIPCLAEFSKMFYRPEKKGKILTKEALYQLNALGLAVWYMDDGCLHIKKYLKKDGNYTLTPTVELHTEDFTKEENELICEYFKDVWGIEANTYCYRGYNYVYMNTGSSKKFLEIVAPYFVKDILDYKLGGFFEPGNRLANIIKGEYAAVEDEICEISLFNSEPKISYDIEVEDNHNFFAGNILVHNCHAVSNMAQNALLKVLEETTGRTFFIMCTTEPNKLLPTIRSRSLELDFETVPKEEIVRNLTIVSEQRDIPLSEEIKLIIADRSAGHMRNAHMLLDKYLLLGEEDFKDSVRSSITLYCKYLVACYMNDKDNVLKYINALMNIPKDDLQSDWNTVITESMRGYTGFEVRHNDIQVLINAYKSDFNVVVSCYFSPWIKNAFLDMCYFQATFLNMYLVISQTIQAKKNTANAISSTQQNTQVNSRVLIR